MRASVPTFHLNLAETNWQAPNQFPELAVGEVHIWRLPLNADKKELKQLAQLLTPEERQRAELSYFEHSYRERVMSRSTLRSLLGRYLQQDPKEIALSTTTLEKPFLAHVKDFHFNVSHAGGYVLLAFTRIAAIGVDLELINPKIKITGLVNRFFSRLEVPVILGEDPASQAPAFFRAWTRKEALIKATGNGLSTPLDQFGVSIELDKAVEVLHTDWAPEEVGSWNLRSFTVTDSLPGAVALKGRIEEVGFYDAKDCFNSSSISSASFLRS